MIRPEDIRERIDKRPFEPFRICMTDGRTYDVTHPELCLLARTTAWVAIPDPKVKRMVMRIDQCALVHIVCIEPLNGKQRRAGGSRKKRG